VKHLLRKFLKRIRDAVFRGVVRDIETNRILAAKLLIHQLQIKLMWTNILTVAIKTG